MKKAFFTVLLVFLWGVVATSCVPQATDEELNQMCENLVKLRGKIELKPADALVTKIETDFADKKKRLGERQERDLKNWDDELAAKLKELEEKEAKAKEEDKGKKKKKKKGKKDEAEEEEDFAAQKKKLEEDYASRKEATKKKYAEELKKIGPEKDKAVADAKKKAGEAVGKKKEAVDKCVADAKKEGVFQEVAQCRIKATSTDQYWNVCR